MFRLLRWFAWLIFFGAVVWFGTTVKLGKRTLFGHLYAIITSREAKELADGTREEAEKIRERLKEERTPSPAAEHKPLDPVSDKDKKALDKLVQEKTSKK